MPTGEICSSTFSLNVWPFGELAKCSQYHYVVCNSHKVAIAGLSVDCSGLVVGENSTTHG